MMQIRNDRLPIAYILALSAVLNLVGITWGLPHYIDWAIDSVAPFRILKAAHYRFSAGWHEIYPPLHFFILAVCNAPFILYLMWTGNLQDPSQFFPFGFTEPLFALTQVILISRIVSALIGIAVIFLVFRVVRELFDQRSAIFSALIATLYYHLLYYSHNANMDVPYLFWTLLAIFSFLRVLKQGDLKDYMLFAVFAVFALSTKDQAAGVFFLSPLPILWARFVESSPTASGLMRVVKVILDRRHILTVLTAAVALILAQNLIFNFSGLIEHIQLSTHIGLTDDVYRYPLTLWGQVRLLLKTASLLATGLTPALFGVCLVGCVYSAVKVPKYTFALLCLVASYYMTFILSLRLVAPRYTLPIGIIMLFFGGKLLAELWQNGPWKQLTRAAICLAFAYAALFPLQLDFLFINDSRYTAERWMQEHFKDGDIVETFVGTNLHNYYPRFPASVRVRTSKLEAGTTWEPHPQRRDRVRLPNLDQGHSAPDYIVLSSFWYGRFLDAREADSSQRQTLRGLCQGTLGYTLVASFKTPTLVDVDDLFVNPKILIFESSNKISASPAPRPDPRLSSASPIPLDARRYGKSPGAILDPGFVRCERFFH